MEPVQREFASQRLRLRYADWGNDGAPALILLHGGRDHCRNWDDTARALRADWHVVAPDLRGHGDSDWANTGHYGMADYVLDLAALIRHLGRDRVAIVAHSLGGNVALRYAGVFPETVSALAAIEGLGPGPRNPPPADATPAHARLGKWADLMRAAEGKPHRPYATEREAIERMRAAHPNLPPDLAAHLARHGSRRGADGAWTWKFDPMVRVWPPYDMPRADIAALWSRIDCPTMLIHGEKSWAKSPAADGRAAYFRHAEVVAVPDAGHWVHHDNPAFFMAAIRRFLASALASEAGSRANKARAARPDGATAREPGL